MGSPVRDVAPAPAVLLVALLALAPALAPPATAQQDPTSVPTETRVTIFDPGDPLPPGETAQLVVAVTYRYGQGANAQDPTPVAVEVADAPAWLATELSNTTVAFPVPPSSATSGRTDQVQLILNVTPSRAIAAFTDGEVQVDARAPANGNLQPSNGSDVQPLQPAYDAALHVEAPEEEPVAGGRAHPLRMTVRNDANAPTRVAVAMEAKPANSLLTLPDPVTLGWNGSEDPLEAVLETVVRVPWSSSEEGALTLQLVPAHAERGDALGTPRTVHVQIVGRSVVPAPTTPLVLAGAAMALGLARSRGSSP